MYERVSQTIQRYQLFSQETPVVLGVSGGADSLCLLDCLNRLGYSVIVAHLDHQLRPESSAEADFVRGVCNQYGVPFTSEAVNIAARAQAAGSLEEVARLARYNFLLRVAEKHGSACVAVGHTADDQVETILMHFLRGSGPVGLQGMLPKTRFTEWVGIQSDAAVDVVRPLIELSRVETLAHCKAQGLIPLVDPSNLDPSFFRNRIRHELLPLLASYNPGIRQVVLRLSEVMRSQVDFNRAQLESTWPQIMSEAGSNAYVIEAQAFRELEPFLQRAILRRGISLLVPTLRDISHEATLRAVAWLQASGETEPLSLPGGLALEMCGERALLRMVGHSVKLGDYPQMIADVEQRFEYPGEVALEGGWRISACELPNSAEMRSRWDADSGQRIAVLDAGALAGELRVRVRRPGDRIQLANVGGRTKITDLMTNRKIPRQMRACWPLVLAGDVVVWVPGIQRSDQALVVDASTRAIILQLHPPGEESDAETAF